MPSLSCCRLFVGRARQPKTRRRRRKASSWSRHFYRSTIPSDARKSSRWWKKRPHPRPDEKPTSSPLRRGFDRQDELEARAAGAVRRCGQLPAMLLDDHAANGEPQAHAVRLRGDESAEYALELLDIDSGPGVFDLHRDGVAAVKRAVKLQQVASICRRGHCLERWVGQIEDDFLNLAGVAEDMRQLGQQLGAHRNAAILQLGGR